MSKILHSGLFARRRTLRLLSSCGDRLALKNVKIFQPAFDRFRHFADEGGHSLPMAHCKMDQRSKMRDKRIAFVFQVEFEPLGRKDGCTSRRPAVSPGKRQCGVLQQENSTDLPLASRATQKPSLLRPMKNAGIASLTMRDRVAEIAR